MMCDHQQLRLGSAFITNIVGVVLLLSAATAGEPAHLITFGDSNTAPRGSVRVYSDLLSESLDDVRVTNAGVGGDHTGRGLLRLHRDVISRKPDIVIIMFGINDSAIDVWKTPPATASRVSVQDFETNLRCIVVECRTVGAIPILMTATPMRWSDATRRLYGKPPYRPDDIDGFNVTLPPYIEATRRVAQQETVALVDNETAFRKMQMERLLLDDGMHLNDAGHRFIADALLPLVRKALVSRGQSDRSD